MPTAFFPLHQPVAIFLVVMLVILCGPLVFKYLKVPNVVGLIIAGVLIGPYCFNILERDASFAIFGQVGILYLMFLAAVEIDMFHLRQNLGKGLLFGLLTFSIPMAAGVFGARLAFGTGWDTCVLLASMYASHTLISYPTVSRLGLQNTRGAVIAVCGTIVAVLLALLALAEVVAVKVSGSFNWSDILRLLTGTAVYAGVVLWSFPRLTRWFFRKFNDTLSQFIFILAMVCISSLLAQVTGLEAIVGAFFAGLVLNRFIPSRSGLMNRIQFVGNAIFIPYFLIGVGMLINVHLIFKGWGVGWAALNMAGVALLSKAVAAWGGARIFGLTATEGGLMFGLTSGKAAATIAATMIGFEYGLLDEDMMNGAVVMILVCCLVSSVVTERVALKLRMTLTDADLQNENLGEKDHYARQLVAVANPVTAESLMKIAMLMRYRGNRSPITALFVRRSDDARTLNSGRTALRTAVNAAMAVDIEVKDVERYDLNVVSGMIGVAHEHGCTDIILGLHRRSTVVDTFYGTLIEQLLAGTHRMLMIVRCFIPVDTIRRLMVVAPRNAEYEPGFQVWVERVANLASQLGCRVIFMAYRSTVTYIRQIIGEKSYEIRAEMMPMDTWDDFILYSANIDDDDLLLVVSARKGSPSWSGDIESMPTFLSRNFKHQNLMVVYPEQFEGRTKV